MNAAISQGRILCIAAWLLQHQPDLLQKFSDADKQAALESAVDNNDPAVLQWVVHHLLGDTLTQKQVLQAMLHALQHNLTAIAQWLAQHPQYCAHMSPEALGLNLAHDDGNLLYVLAKTGTSGEGVKWVVQQYNLSLATLQQTGVMRKLQKHYGRDMQSWLLARFGPDVVPLHEEYGMYDYSDEDDLYPDENLSWGSLF